MIVNIKVHWIFFFDSLDSLLNLWGFHKLHPNSVQGVLFFISMLLPCHRLFLTSPIQPSCAFFSLGTSESLGISSKVIKSWDKRIF